MDLVKKGDTPCTAQPDPREAARGSGLRLLSVTVWPEPALPEEAWPYLWSQEMGLEHPGKPKGPCEDPGGFPLQSQEVWGIWRRGFQCQLQQGAAVWGKTSRGDRGQGVMARTGWTRQS